MSIAVHRFDLPADIDLGNVVAVDTETMGLRPGRDRLCVVQLSAGDGSAHLVHFPEPDYTAPRLRALLGDASVLKIFHYARFDLAVLKAYLELSAAPVFCTKVASKLVRTYTDRHGLKDLCRELLGKELSKEQQSSDWGAAKLSDQQVKYAANDVLFLHQLRDALNARLERENRAELAAACFAFLPVRAELDLAGWADEDVFAH